MNIRTIFQAYLLSKEKEDRANKAILSFQEILRSGYTRESLEAMQQNKALEFWQKQLRKHYRQTSVFRNWLLRDGMVASPPWYAYTEGTEHYMQLESMKDKLMKWRSLEPRLKDYATAFDNLMRSGKNKSGRAALIHLLMRERHLMLDFLHDYAIVSYSELT